MYSKAKIGDSYIGLMAVILHLLPQEKKKREREKKRRERRESALREAKNLPLPYIFPDQGGALRST